MSTVLVNFMSLHYK